MGSWCSMDELPEGNYEDDLIRSERIAFKNQVDQLEDSLEHEKMAAAKKRRLEKAEKRAKRRTYSQSEVSTNMNI